MSIELSPSPTSCETERNATMSSSIGNGTSTAINEFSKRDYEYTIQMNRWFLRPIGIWPTPSNAGIFERIKIASTICCSYLFIFFLLVPCGLHTFLIEQNPALRLKMIGPLSFTVMAVTKFSFLVFHRDDIGDCLEHVATDWSSLGSTRERDIMLRDAKFGRFVTSLCAAFMYGGGIFYHMIMPLSCGTIVNPDNESVRLLTFSFYDQLFDVQASPTYEIIFVAQCFSGFVIDTVTVGAFSIAAVFAIHACGQFKVVVGRLDKLVDGDDARNDSVDQRTSDIVKGHLRALRLARQLEGILNEVCFVELIGCTMNICFLGYYFMMEWEQSEVINTVTYCVLLISFIFNILIFCYIGDKLAEQSEYVGTMTYMIDWYRLQSTKARGLILILIISKYPAHLTAGKMVALSMRCFSDVMKTALTYLNLLRAMAD